MTEAELKENYGYSLSDMRISLDELNEKLQIVKKEVRENSRKANVNEAEYKEALDFWIRRAVLTATKRWYDKFVIDGGAPDKIYNEDGTEYIPGQDDEEDEE